MVYSFRAFGVGVCSSAGRVGAILGILLVDAGLVYGSVTALVIVGILSWTAGLVVLLSLPERAFKPLFDNADQETTTTRTTLESSVMTTAVERTTALEVETAASPPSSATTAAIRVTQTLKKELLGVQKKDTKVLFSYRKISFANTRIK